MPSTTWPAWLDDLRTTDGGEKRPVGEIASAALVLTGKYSPCRECANTLTDLATRFPGAELILDYSKARELHPDWEGNPNACDAAIRGWQVTGFADQGAAARPVTMARE